jgi:hypothetical protein
MTLAEMKDNMSRTKYLDAPNVRIEKKLAYEIARLGQIKTHDLSMTKVEIMLNVMKLTRQLQDLKD